MKFRVGFELRATGTFEITAEDAGEAERLVRDGVPIVELLEVCLDTSIEVDDVVEASQVEDETLLIESSFDEGDETLLVESSFDEGDELEDTV